MEESWPSWWDPRAEVPDYDELRNDASKAAAFLAEYVWCDLF